MNHPQNKQNYSTIMTSSVPFIPVEIHRMIAVLLDSPDLTAYRLVCKSFADIGKEHLFRVTSVHCSHSSTRRIKEIKEHAEIREEVEVLVWDTNLWKIPGVSDLHEWKSYFFRKSNFLEEYEQNYGFQPGHKAQKLAAKNLVSD